MRLTRLFYEGSLVTGTVTQLAGEPAHYLGRVLRVRTGDEVELFDGSGQVFAATVNTVSRRAVELAIGDRREGIPASPCRISLWQALCRNEKMDWVLQKAVELGVADLQPLVTTRSTAAPPADRLPRRLAHWQSVIVGAAQQSGRSELPTLQSPQALTQLLTSTTPTDLKLVATPNAEQSLAALLDERPASNVVLAVGPEGGFAPEELAVLLEHDFVAVSAGPRVLRTETAAISLLSVIQSRYGDWR